MNKQSNIDDEAGYRCAHCGEDIVVPLDLSERQEVVEDCPVCCGSNVLNVRVMADGTMNLSVREE